MPIADVPGKVVDDVSGHLSLAVPLQQWRHSQQAQLTDQWQLAGAQRQPSHVTVAPPPPWRHARQPPIIAARCLPTMTYAYVTAVAVVSEIEIWKKYAVMKIYYTYLLKFQSYTRDENTNAFVKQNMAAFL